MNSPVTSLGTASQHPRWGIVALCCAALWSLGGCTRHPPTASAPAVVVASPVHAVAAEEYGLRFPAEIAARYSNTMSFRVSGKLIDRRVRLGDLVKQGQMLARLDPADAEQQVASAQAALDAAAHRLAFAQQQLERDLAQSNQNLISAAQFEQTQDAYNAAQSARDQAAAQLAIARNTLRYDTLYAEHDGLITSENADTGEVVAAGQAVYGLAWSGDTDITLDVAEDRVGDIRIDQRATVSFPSLPSRRMEARVREIAPAADPLSRTFRVRLSLTAPERDLRLGMTGEAVLAAPDDGPTTTGGSGAVVRADGAAADVFVLPATAIFHEGSEPAVWVVRPSDSRLELRAVAIRRYDAETATISSGLQDGDSVVLAGVHTVFAGELVRPVAPLFTATESSSSGPADEAGTADVGRAGRR